MPRFGAEVSSSHMARKLYVGNLPYTTGEQDLESLFAAAGTVESVSVMRDMATGRARGFAFVEMATEDEAQPPAVTRWTSRFRRSTSMISRQDNGARCPRRRIFPPSGLVYPRSY